MGQIRLGTEDDLAMLKLKGSMRVSHFTLEVDCEFKNPGDIEKFIEWAEKLRIFHPPNKANKNDGHR